MVRDGHKIQPFWSRVTAFIFTTFSVPNICCREWCCLGIFEDLNVSAVTIFFVSCSTMPTCPDAQFEAKEYLRKFDKIWVPWLDTQGTSNPVQRYIGLSRLVSIFHVYHSVQETTDHCCINYFYYATR